MAGEAGVGKTLLLRRFCAPRAARVLWGDCDALFTRSPLGPLTDIAATPAASWRTSSTRARPPTR